MKFNLRSGRGIILLVLLLFFFFYNFAIVQKERFLAHGDAIILALAPVDPRSLMQGDYMILDFAIQTGIRKALNARYDYDEMPRKGRAVIVEKKGEHVFRRLYEGESLGKDERLLEYTLEGRRLKIGGGSFFFEEGLAGLYNHARYAQVRVDSGGKAIISGLLDKDKRLLVKERWDAEKRELRD